VSILYVYLFETTLFDKACSHPPT